MSVLTILARRKRPRRRLADLAALTKIMVGNHACHHGFTDRYCTNTDAGVMAALGRNFGFLAITIDGTARGEDRGRRLDCEAYHHGLTGRNAPKDASRVIGEESRFSIVAHAHLVTVLFAGKLGGS